MPQIPEPETLDSITARQAWRRFRKRSGRDIEIPKHNARAIDFVKKSELENNQRLEEKITKKARITDHYVSSTGEKMAKHFDLINDLNDGDEVELREAPFESVTTTREHMRPNIRDYMPVIKLDKLPAAARTIKKDVDNALTFGTVDFETGARLKARRKGDTIYIDGVAEKGFQDRYDFDGKYKGYIDSRGTPFKIFSRWEHPFKATMVVKDGKVDSHVFDWLKEE